MVAFLLTCCKNHCILAKRNHRPESESNHTGQSLQAFVSLIYLFKNKGISPPEMLSFHICEASISVKSFSSQKRVEFIIKHS